MTDHQFSCPVCASTQGAVVSARRQARADGGTTLDFTDYFSQCAKCGEEFYTREQSLASSRAAATVLRQHEGLLPPDRIRAIRESHGVTQADFERALRLGPKT